MFLQAVRDGAYAPFVALSLPQNAEEKLLRFLTPTENKRLNELIGFLCLTLAILVGLALLSYSPHDAAFNVSASPLDNQHVTRNWIGPVGSYSADLLFQVFGYAAFLLPAAMLVLGWRWLRSRAIDSQVATLLGYGLLLLSLPSLLTLMPFPPVRTAIPAGGLLGTLIAGSLRTGFNLTGAYVVAFGGVHHVGVHDHELFRLQGRTPGPRAQLGHSGRLRSWAFCRRRRRGGRPGVKAGNMSVCGGGWKKIAWRDANRRRRSLLARRKC